MFRRERKDLKKAFRGFFLSAGLKEIAEKTSKQTITKIGGVFMSETKTEKPKKHPLDERIAAALPGRGGPCPAERAWRSDSF